MKSALKGMCITMLAFLVLMGAVYVTVSTATEAAKSDKVVLNEDIWGDGRVIKTIEDLPYGVPNEKTVTIQESACEKEPDFKIIVCPILDVPADRTVIHYLDCSERQRTFSGSKELVIIKVDQSVGIVNV